MYKAVKSVVEANSSAWAGLPAFDTVFNTFSSKVDLLQTHAYNQGLALVGVSAVKDAKREEVSEKAFSMASSIAAFAVITNKAGLIEQMRINKWSIRMGAHQHALQVVDLIIEKATEHVNDLGDFGVDQNSITELQTLRDELEVLFTAPRNAIVERKTITAQIKVLDREISLMLKLQLDKLMVVLQEDNPEFFDKYKNARIIVDLKNPSSGSESNTGGYGE